MDLEEFSALFQDADKRRRAIARGWYAAITSAGALSMKKVKALHHLTGLAEQVITFLLTDTSDSGSARMIGADLARLSNAQPNVLETVLQVLARQLVIGLPADHIVILYPRLVTMLSGIAVGFFQPAGVSMLEKQKQSHQPTRDISERERMEKLLRESEEMWQAITNATSDSVFLLDAAGTVLASNDKTAERLGKSRSEIIGKCVYDLLPPDLAPKRKAHIEKAIRLGRSVQFEDTRQERWIEHSVCPIVNEQGKVTRVAVYARDITGLKQSEIAYHALLENSFQGTVIIQDDRIVYANPVVIESYGYPFSELKSLTLERIVDFVHPEDRAMAWASLQADLAHEPVHEDNEFRILDKNGNTHWLETIAVVIGYSGKPALQISMIDRTERHLAETSLRASEEQYRLITQTSIEGIYQLDSSGNLIFINDAFAKMFGYTREELSGKPFNELLLKGSLGNTDSLRKKALSGGILRGEFPLRHKDGHVIYVYYSFVAIKNNGQVIFTGILSDITDRKQSEDVLRESEGKYRSLVERANDGITIIQDEIIKFANPRLAEMRDEAIEKLVGVRFDKFIHPDELPKITERYRRRLAGEQVPSTYDTVLLRKDNSKVFVELSAGIIQYEGKPADLVIVRDITERKRIEETLHASEERYRILAEASHDLIYVVNLDGYIEYVNTFAAQQLGMPPDKVIGKPWKKFVDPPVAERQNRHLKSVIETGEPKRTEEQLQFLGRKVWLSTWLVPLRDPSGVVSAVMGVSRDISQRKVREHELREAKDRLEKRVAERTAKLAASHEQLRRLTQKVVLAQEEERRRVSRELHDETGQALIGLRFSMDAILDDTPAELAPLRKRLAETTASITQMMERIQSLAYSLRPPVLEIVGINLGLKDLCSEFSERTHLSVNYSGLDLPNLPDVISISFYRFLQETMTNVVKHAHASQIQITLAYKDGTITLSVEDNGKGFRHKTNQRGIGLLGLEERLRLLGGRLAIKSRLGHGSRVTAYIPWRSDETEIRV